VTAQVRQGRCPKVSNSCWVRASVGGLPWLRLGLGKDFLLGSWTGSRSDHMAWRVKAAHLSARLFSMSEAEACGR
jgi:hypothetical protein